MGIKKEETVNLIIQFALAIAMVLGLANPAAAVCTQTSASTADQDLWDTHGCWSDYFLWQYRAYDMNGTDWSNRGWDDACNSSLEYPKHWNAAYLVTYGLADNNDQSFHGAIDYRAAGEASGSQFHDHFTHVPTDRTDIFGSFSNNQVATACPLYNPTSANANPGSRAGDFMHEGWHAWMQKYNWDNGSVGGHRPTQGNCTVSGCDYFYFHGIGQYAFGALWENDGTANRFHSPNQVQVEFLCDVADQPQSWVPNSVRISSQNDANTRAAERFINGPGYRCGDPRPW
jgi:hypothetical protein